MTLPAFIGQPAVESGSVIKGMAPSFRLQEWREGEGIRFATTAVLPGSAASSGSGATAERIDEQADEIFFRELWPIVTISQDVGMVLHYQIVDGWKGLAQSTTFLRTQCGLFPAVPDRLQLVKDGMGVLGCQPVDD